MPDGQRRRIHGENAHAPPRRQRRLHQRNLHQAGRRDRHPDMRGEVALMQRQEAARGRDSVGAQLDQLRRGRGEGIEQTARAVENDTPWRGPRHHAV
jgi:hypothetical protein